MPKRRKKIPSGFSGRKAGEGATGRVLIGEERKLDHEEGKSCNEGKKADPLKKKNTFELTPRGDAKRTRSKKKKTKKVRFSGFQEAAMAFIRNQIPKSGGGATETKKPGRKSPCGGIELWYSTRGQKRWDKKRPWGQKKKVGPIQMPKNRVGASLAQKLEKKKESQHKPNMQGLKAGKGGEDTYLRTIPRGATTG